MGFTKYLGGDPSPWVCGQSEATGIDLYVKIAKIEKTKDQQKLEGHINEEYFFSERVQEIMDFIGIGEVEVRELNRVFRAMDTDASGQVSVNEMFVYIKEKPTQLGDALFEMLDETSGDGEMNFSEFVHAVCTLSMFGRAEILRFCFAHYDKDASGTIDVDELRELIDIQSKGAPAFLK